MKETCQLCGMFLEVRNHHIIPKSKGGNVTIHCCETCETFCHSTWSHNELRDTYNTVESILSTETFQKFLKWRLKQDTMTVFKSDRGQFRSKRKYS